MLLPALLSLAFAEPSMEEIQQMFGQKPADFLFLLESSQELLPQAESLRQPIANLIRVLPDGDRVALATFHTRTSLVVPFTTLNADNREALAVQIAESTLPGAKEVDLGAALSLVEEQLGRKAAAPIQFLMMSGMFCHNPSIQSPWHSGGRGCQQIRDLDKLKAQLQQAVHPEVLLPWFWWQEPAPPVLPQKGKKAVKAPDAPHTEAVDRQQAWEVIAGVVGPGQEVLDAKAWLEDCHANLINCRYAPVARHMVQVADLKIEVSKTPTLAEPRLELKLSPTAAPIHLSHLKVEGASGAPSELDLNEPTLLPLTVQVQAPGMAILPTQDTVPLELKISADLQLQPESLWASMGVDSLKPGQHWSLSTEVTRVYGLPKSTVGLMLAVGLAGLAFGGYSLRARLSQQKLGGRFSWRKEGGARQDLDISGHAEASIGINAKGEVAIVKSDQAVLVISRTGPQSAIVEIRRDGVEINSRSISKGKHMIVPGAASFQFGAYRLLWE